MRFVNFVNTLDIINSMSKRKTEIEEMELSLRSYCS